MAPSTSQSNEKLGYPLMEALIETEDFNKYNQSMSQSYDLLERQSKQKTGGLSRQKKIRQALKAYDLTIDLIRFLLKSKYDMVAKSQGGDEKNKKKGNPDR